MSDAPPVDVAGRLRAVRERIEAAAARVGRDPVEVVLVGACKAQPLERIRSALEAGLRDLGENYVQPWRLRARELAGLPVRWHFIGALQRNKVRHLVGPEPGVGLIHSVDRPRLAEEIARRATAAGRVQDVLLQVNVGREASKAGVDPGDLLPLYRALSVLPGLRVRGLMAIPPAVADPRAARPHFRALAELGERICAVAPPGAPPPAALSMGMSGDFEVAVEEGATLVRLGSAIFGARPARE